MSERTEIRRVLGEESDHEIKQKRGGSMKANTATLADVKLVLSAPKHIQTKRCGYSKALVTFGLAQTKFMDHATSTTWTSTVEAARQLHAEAKRAEREREAAASRAARDEGGEARWP
jgi:alpha-ketoglutarate-dependent taurine dioxygenase